MPKNKTTPRPWRVEPKQSDHGATIAIVGQYKNAGFIVAEIPCTNLDDEPDMQTATRHPADKPNAELIARAVNSHTKSIDAMRNALSVLNRLCDESEKVNHDKRVAIAIKALQKALKIAGGTLWN